mgnify:CR=1 FL=1
MSQEYADWCFGAKLQDIDPDVGEIIRLEEERQARHLILIPSESMAPAPVREALSSVFNNVYAEGYPPLRMTREEEKLLLDFGHQLTHYRRYGDRRFYKGAEYVHFVEALAQRRCAQAFANGQVRAENIYVNVQPLSGAAANLAVYEAFMQPGDVLMGMDLLHGGHLTHGSEFNISGKRYRVASYGVNRATGQLDYAQIMNLAREVHPKIIVAGYTSYPWAPDWEKFREIADACGAFLMADIAHPAGMVVAGAYPSPVGLADVITFTTHKTLFGPRGACILTTDEENAQRVDMAVFPGEQGGPHVNKFAAMAVAFKIAQSDCFKALQHKIVDNAQHLAEALKKEGLKLAYGGTNTHLLVIDLNGVKTPTGYPLRGEIAVRILDLAGIVANKNTIPGDEITALGMGVRLGTPWLTQRGMGRPEMEAIAAIIAKVLKGIRPFSYIGLKNELPRGKIDQSILEEAKCQVSALAESATAETCSRGTGYPHYCLSDGRTTPPTSRGLLLILGWRATAFLQQVSTRNVALLQPGESQHTLFLERDGSVLDEVHLLCLEPDDMGRQRYVVATTSTKHEQVKTWLRNLSDGYILFDDQDLFRKVEGPVAITDLLLEHGESDPIRQQGLAFCAGLPAPLELDGKKAAALYKDGHADLFDLTKPYFVGQQGLESIWPKSAPDKAEWRWVEPTDAPLQRTPLYDVHAQMTRKIIPFAGWEMPVWYTSVSDEHRAVRQAAALFDVAHMGVFEVSGEHATSFLDTVCSNYARWLDDGQSLYAYLFDPDGNVIDDIMVYRRRTNQYLLVVNASNADKDWDWLNAVNEGRVILDRDRPALTPEGKAILRNLKDPSSGEDQRVDLALQGPASLALLQSLTEDRELKAALARVRRTELIECELAGFDLIIARTGYCGEKIGYEIFVHPDRAVAFWLHLLERGASFGLKPAGLGARDSTRIEAGLPLYGHELAGPFNIDPVAAGFGSYVKLHKPFFIGRKAFIEKALQGKKQIVRFRMNEKGVRMPSLGDPVLNKRGKVIGNVTSCSLDSHGYLLGLALVDKRFSKEGTPIGIFVLPHHEERTLPPEKPKDQLSEGDQVLLHDEATVISRFPGENEIQSWRLT